MSTDWRNGFLFVGNQLVLDFVNTRPIIDGKLTEMVPDGGAFARWLGAAGLLGERGAARVAQKWSAPSFAAAIEDLRESRENMRKVIFDLEAGEPPPAAFIKELNRLLIHHPAVDQVVNAGANLERRRRFAPETPADAVAPLADAMADLVTTADPSRIRKCPGCILHFYDTSKKGTRMWCSMRMCGNRAKVAAFAERQRATPKEAE